MDLKELLADHTRGFPAGLCGCRAHGNSFDLCDYDVVVFDGKSASSRIMHENRFINIHHCPIDETNTGSLVHLHDMHIILDESWDLRILLGRLWDKRAKLFREHARNCLIESLLCCEKCKRGMQNSDVFYACWQKCASYMLADAILALNQKPPSPSHALDLARKFEKNNINEKMSIVTETLGLERATPSLLERMAKSTIGFADIVENGNHSKTIQSKYDYFVRNSMFSDCYFYLGYVNKLNFIGIKNLILRRPDLIHVLKTAFDLESDPILISQHISGIHAACHEILSQSHG